MYVALSIRLPFIPGRALSPNGRVSWPVKYRAMRSLRDDVIALVREQGWFREPLDRAHLELYWEAKDHLTRDLDNLLSSSKAAIDGLVVAGVLVDDSASRLTMSLHYEGGCEENATTLRVLA